MRNKSWRYSIDKDGDGSFNGQSASNNFSLRNQGSISIVMPLYNSFSDEGFMVEGPWKKPLSWDFGKDD